MATLISGKRSQGNGKTKKKNMYKQCKKRSALERKWRRTGSGMWQKQER